ncbi:MAG: DUF1080 domain-containing protein [Planctomycetota bacterium]
MRFAMLFVAALPVGSLSSCSLCCPDKPSTAGFDMEDWIQVLDSEWKLSGDGILSSAQDPNGRLKGESWLLTKRDYTDFELEIDYRITKGGNSGVFFRDPISREQRLKADDGAKPAPWDAGYEANINNDHDKYPSGAIWAIAGAPPKLQKEDEWNHLKVKVQGQRVWTWLNGTLAVDGFELPERSTSGAIGLQRHGGEQYKDKLVEFKNLSIREL